MAKTKKTFRAVALIVALMMLAALVPVVVMADTITLTDDDISYDEETGTFTVEAKHSLGKEITMLAVLSNTELDAVPAFDNTGGIDEDNIMYVEQETVTDADGDYSKSFLLRDTAAGNGNVLTVFMGGTDVDTVAIAHFTMQVPAPVLSFGATSYYVDDDVVITFTDDATWRAAISAVKVDGTALVAGTDYAVASGTITIDGGVLAAGTYGAGETPITVEATDYAPASVTGTTTISKIPGGTAALSTKPEGRNYIYGLDTLKLILTDGGHPGWEAAALAAAEVQFADGTQAGTIESDGTITLTAIPEALTNYKVVIALDSDTYENAAPAALTFSAISRVGYTKSSYTKATWDAETDNTKFTFTIPADYTDSLTGAGVVYSVTVGGAAQDISTVKTFDVLRDADDPISVIVTATITYTDLPPATTTQTITVPKLGDSVNPITAANITFRRNAQGAIRQNVYGISGATAIDIVLEQGTIDPEAKTITVDGIEMYYSPQRSVHKDVFTGIIFIEDADENAVALNAEIADKASEKIYYGRALSPLTSGTIALTQVAPIIQMINNVYEVPGSVATERRQLHLYAAYLSADVSGNASITLPTAAYVVQVVNQADPFSVFNILKLTYAPAP